MESKVHQTLSYIFCFDFCRFLERTEIDDEFVSASATASGVQHFVWSFQTSTHIVGVQNSVFSRSLQPFIPQHPDISITNQKNARGSKCRSGNCVGLHFIIAQTDMAGDKRSKV